MHGSHRNEQGQPIHNLHVLSPVEEGNAVGTVLDGLNVDGRVRQACQEVMAESESACSGGQFLRSSRLESKKNVDTTCALSFTQKAVSISTCFQFDYIEKSNGKSESEWSIWKPMSLFTRFCGYKQ